MARRNAQQSSRRNPAPSRGRRVTSQGGFPGGVQPDIYPMIQQIAHSAQRFYNGQSPYKQFQVNPGGPMRQGQNVNPGGPVKSPGPGRKVNPGGPQVGVGAGGGGVNPGGMPNWVGDSQQRWPDWVGGFDPGGTMHNHGQQQHDHPGGGPGHTHGDGGQQIQNGGPPQGQQQGQGGGGQNQPPPQYVQNWMPPHPEAFARRFPTYADYTAGVQDPRRQAFYDWAMSQAQQQGGGGQGQGQGQGGGGGQGGGQGGGGQGGGGGQQQQQPAGQPPSPFPPPPPTPTPTGQPAGLAPTLGNTYGGSYTSTPGTGGLMQGSFMNPEANDTERFQYDPFTGGQTYKPMPAGMTGQAPSNYPFQGYAPPPSNVGYFNPGQGWNWNAPTKSWADIQAAMQQPNIANDIQPIFKQNAPPPAAQNVWWANPVVTQPGQYDPWVELRNLQQHFGNATPGNLAGNNALGLDTSAGQLNYYRYLAHMAGIPGYANLTGPLPTQYHPGA